jgi:hypothetical protein
MVGVVVGANSPDKLGSTGKSLHLHHQPYQNLCGNCPTLDKLRIFKYNIYLCSRLAAKDKGGHC